MKLGFSIENRAFLRNVDAIEIANHKNLQSFLEYIRSNGVTSVEFRKLGRGEDAQAYQESIQLIWDMGMELTIHADINGDFAGKRFVDIYPSLTYILNHFEQYQSRIVMAIHAYQTGNGSRSAHDLGQQTIEVLGNWTSMIEAEGLPVYLALEINRDKKSTVDPGNSVDGVVGMVEAVNNKHLGICWDMGHYYSNLSKKNGFESRSTSHLNDLPSESFLKRVFHTHIHGLNAQGITHFPLTEPESLPLERYVEALQSHDYNGVYNLELSFSRWDQGLSTDRTISSTITRLRECHHDVPGIGG